MLRYILFFVLISFGWILVALKILFKKVLENRKEKNRKKTKEKNPSQPSSAAAAQPPPWPACPLLFSPQPTRPPGFPPYAQAQIAHSPVPLGPCHSPATSQAARGRTPLPSLLSLFRWQPGPRVSLPSRFSFLLPSVTGWESPSPKARHPISPGFSRVKIKTAPYKAWCSPCDPLFASRLPNRALDTISRRVSDLAEAALVPHRGASSLPAHRPKRSPRCVRVKLLYVSVPLVLCLVLRIARWEVTGEAHGGVHGAPPRQTSLRWPNRPVPSSRWIVAVGLKIERRD